MDTLRAVHLRRHFVLKQLNQVFALFKLERPEVSVIDAATLLQWPRSTTYRVLSQFEKARFLDRDPETGLYRLGIRLATLGELAQRSTSLQRIARPVLQRLSRRTGETATLLVMVEGEGIAVLHSEGSHRVVAKALLGRYWPLHASAGGKALLAWHSDSEVEALIRRPLKRYTPATITNVAALARELRQIRERGFATVRGEFNDDVWGVAVPIFNHREELEGAITLGGPRSRVTQGRFGELGKVLMSHGEHVSRLLGYEGDYPRSAAGRDPDHIGHEGAAPFVAPVPTRRQPPRRTRRQGR